MEPDKLYTKLKGFFPNQLDLMRYLHVKACWEYVITEQSTDEANIKLNFFLFKKNEISLEMTKTKPYIVRCFFYLNNCFIGDQFKTNNQFVPFPMDRIGLKCHFFVRMGQFYFVVVWPFLGN